MKREALELLYLAKLEKKARECRQNFFSFFQYFWDTIVPDPLVLNWHIKYLCNELQKIGFRLQKREKNPYDLVINIPPGTTKSTIVTIMWPAWLWLIDPTLRGINTSYSGDVAMEHAVKSRDVLKSAKFQELYPDHIIFKIDQDNKSRYENTAGGSRACTGTGGRITSKHAHFIIEDDPLSPKQAVSETMLKTANDFSVRTLSTRKVDKKVSTRILVMQRLHEDDPAGRKLQQSNVKHICLPAEITELENVQPKELEKNYIDGLLDPSRMDKEVLNNFREELGSAEYAGQFLQSPRAAEGNILKREWWRFYDVLPDIKIQRIIQSYDTAFKKADHNDFCAVTTWYEFPNGFYLVDLWHKKVNYPELKVQAHILGNEWRPHIVLIPDTDAGQALIPELARESKLPVYAVAVTKDKISNAMTASPTIEAGKVFLPNTAAWKNIFLEQMSGFPNVKHDDIVDSVTQFLNWVREHPFETPVAIGKPRNRSLTEGF